MPAKQQGVGTSDPLWENGFDVALGSKMCTGREASGWRPCGQKWSPSAGPMPTLHGGFNQVVNIPQLAKVGSIV